MGSFLSVLFNEILLYFYHLFMVSQEKFEGINRVSRRTDNTMTKTEKDRKTNNGRQNNTQTIIDWAEKQLLAKYDTEN